MFRPVKGQVKRARPLPVCCTRELQEQGVKCNTPWVQVFYRRPAGDTQEPQRIQFATDAEACASDGWAPLPDIAHDVPLVLNAAEHNGDHEQHLVPVNPHVVRNPCTAIVPYVGPVNQQGSTPQVRKSWNFKGLFPRYHSKGKPETLREAAYRRQ